MEDWISKNTWEYYKLQVGFFSALSFSLLIFNFIIMIIIFLMYILVSSF